MKTADVAEIARMLRTAAESLELGSCDTAELMVTHDDDNPKAGSESVFVLYVTY